MPQYATTEDVADVRQDLRIHIQDDRAFQDKIYGYLVKRFDKIDLILGQLWDEKNQRDGALSKSKEEEEKISKTKAAFAQVSGWSVNAFIAAITAYATIHSLK